MARASRLFSPSFDALRVDVRLLNDWLTLVVLSDSADAALPHDLTRVVWGCAVGDSGLAGEAEIGSALASASGPRELLGRFAVVDLPGDNSSPVNAWMGADLGHVLKLVRGTRREAVSTSGVLATLLSGRSLEVSLDRVGEYLAFDSVLGEFELLDGVELLPEASQVQLRANGTVTGVYWPLEDRFSPGAPVSPRSMWEHLRANASRVFASDEMWLGLTSGRDSTLLASAAAAVGAHPTCFTFGDATYWDVHGARAVCDSMSWEHVNVWRTATVPISSRKIAAYAAWTDGLETARNLYGAPWSPDFSDKIFVSGHGGEIGRAFYWKDAIGSPNGHLAVLARFAGSLVPARWSSTTEERVHAEVDRYHWLKPTARLDAFYARSRTRNWTGRGIRRRNFSGGVMGFCDPETVRILLGVPDELKRDAAFFDEVIACDTRRLRDVAKSAAALQWAALTSGGKSVGATPPSSEMRDATKVGIRLFGHGSLLRDAFGPKWCGRLLRNAARRQPDHFRRALWNAASVEGLHRLANGAEHSRHA